MNIQERADVLQVEKHEKTPSYPGNFEILSPKQFFSDFQQYANGASVRIYAQSMYIEAGSAFYTIANSLIAAKEKDIDARLHYDYYSHMIEGQQIVWIPAIKSTQRKTRKVAIEAKEKTLRDLQEANVIVTVTNPPNLIAKVLPFVGRNHIKMAIIDDVAWIGGISYRDGDLEKVDFMMRFTDPSIVKVLAQQFHMVNDKRVPQDTQYRCNNETVVVVDRGNPGKSRIFDYSLALIKKAQSSVKLATQYSPNGVMASALYEAHKEGKNVKAVVSSNSTIAEWFGRVHDTTSNIVTKIRGNQIPMLNPENRVHAKALLVDEDIPKIAVGGIGSHNLTRTGVLLGTQELFVFSTNPDFIQNLSLWFHDLEIRSSLRQPNREK